MRFCENSVTLARKLSGKRIGVSACRRLGGKTAFRRGYNDQEVSTKFDGDFADADTPARRYADTFPLSWPQDNFAARPSALGKLMRLPYLRKR
jgi:hypothetical protein